ncbi:hypothetical protein C8J57DRAFT_1245212 [Mycena rebaudengoi]|nr:hypothetical protein C8J57DRAFT_1245212 [Mycena rebaudengoi]
MTCNNGMNKKSGQVRPLIFGGRVFAGVQVEYAPLVKFLRWEDTCKPFGSFYPYECAPGETASRRSRGGIEQEGVISIQIERTFKKCEARSESREGCTRRLNEASVSHMKKSRLYERFVFIRETRTCGFILFSRVHTSAPPEKLRLRGGIDQENVISADSAQSPGSGGVAQVFFGDLGSILGFLRNEMCQRCVWEGRGEVGVDGR